MKPVQGDFLGTGWSFPPAFSKGGEDVLMVSREEDIMQSLLILLGTSLDERAMREDYGCNLRDYLFEELDPRLLNQLRNAISNSVRLHEPRINLEDIHFDVQADYAQSLINIEIQFLVRSTNSRYNMVYPFYLTEGSSGARALTITHAPQPITPSSVFLDSGSNSEEVTPSALFSAFIHRPTEQSTGNWSRNYSVLDHPQLDGNPEAIFFVAPLWGIGIAGAPTLDALEVGYVENLQRWAIYSKNPAVRMRDANNTPYFLQVLIPAGVVVQQKNAFVHQATPSNIRYNRSVLDTNNFAKGNPNAFVLVTPRKGTHSNHEINVSYHAEDMDRWCIANAVRDGNASYEAQNAMPDGALFNVLILPTEQLGNLRAFSHQGNPDNTIERGTYINHELVNGKSQIPLFFTQAWRPEYTPSSGAHNPHHCQLWFDAPDDPHLVYKNNHWFIWSPEHHIPPGTIFNLFAVIE